MELTVMKQKTSTRHGSVQSMRRKNKYNAQGIYLLWYGEKKFFHSKAEAERDFQRKVNAGIMGIVLT